LAELITPDLCVIGAGLGGLTAVADARALGASVVLVERDRLGGDNLGTGSIPSKALAAAAARAHLVRGAGAFGIGTEEPRINSRRVHDAVEQVIGGLGVRDAAARVEALGAQVVKGEARFTDSRTVTVGDTTIRARRFVIATGARSVVPPIPGLDAVPYFTSETIFDNTRKLTHLVIIGGGPIGLELAQSHRRLGTQVTVVEAGTPLSGADPDLAAIVLQRLAEEGVDIRANSTVSAIQPRSQGIGVVVKTGADEVALDASHILVAETRVPNIELLDLDKAGIKRLKADPRYLEVSPGLRTTNRRVYAIGDAAGGPQYGHFAAWHAGIVVKNAILGLPVRADVAMVPTVVGTDPEIAEVGLSETAARAKHADRFVVVRASYADNDRARTTRTPYGVAKLMVGPTGKILGAGVVGDRAGELVALFAYAMANGLTVGSFTRFVAPHPSFAALARELAVEYSRGRGVTPVLQRLANVVRLVP
jgi:pyruvate/2-oxoglutarate dehydrogenase complex dihydrolipoamide dehydrogenase (E3) component